VSDDGLSRFSRNAFHNLSALLLPAALSLVTTPFIVHRLGDERFGLYMLTLSMVGFGGLLDLGLNTAAIKFVAEEYTRKDVRALSGILNSLLLSRFFLGALAASIGTLAAPFLSRHVLAVTPRLTPDAVFLLRIASLSVGLGMLVGTLASLPRAAHRFDITSRITLLAGVTLTLATVGIVSVGRGIREIAVVELTVTIMQLIVYWNVCRSLFPGWQLEFSLEGSWLRRLLGFGGFVALGNVTSIVFIHVNRILVGRFLGTAAVTYFTVPWSISARLSQFVYSLAEVVAPVASSLSAGNGAEQLERVYRRVTKVVLLLCGTMAVPIFLGAPEFLTLWMGPVFGQRGGIVLRLLTVSAVLQSLAMVTYLVLTGMGRPAAANLPALAGALVNLTVALFVGPRFGLVGIAAAVLVGVAVQTVLLEWRIGVAFSRASVAAVEIRQIALASIGAVAVGFSVRPFLGGSWQRLTASAAVGAICFHGLLWALGAYSRSEREVLSRQIRSIFSRATSGGPQQPYSRPDHTGGPTPPGTGI
jgi:O-antigen/teichoic acid export membrane protein